MKLSHQIVRINFSILIFTFIIASIASGSTYIVDRDHSSASDSNPGTLTSPWKTILHAAETIVAGDTVFIRNGVYSEQVWTNQDGSASSGHIVFSAYPGEKPVIDGSGVTTGSTGFSISHSYIKLIGLEIRNWDTGIWMELGGHIEINDCEVHHNFYGIGAADGAHDFVLNRVEIHHFDLYGFDASPSGGADCYNGTFNDCVSYTGRDRGQNVDGFALGHGTQHDFVFNRCTTFDVYDGFDISSRNTTLNGCLAYNCWNGAYKLWQVNTKLINCIGYNCSSAVVELDWDGEPGKSSLVNCTFFHGETYTIWVENANDTLELYNSIIAGGDNIGLAFEQMGVQNYYGDYNLFQNNNAERAIAVAYTDEFTLDQVKNGAWTSYSGQDAHSIVATSPANLFADIDNLDFHLAENSPAIDQGALEWAPSMDFDGRSRPVGNGVDIGAFEYQSAVAVSGDRKKNNYPETPTLLPNYPNPFNSMTEIHYVLPAHGFAEVSIYDITGRKIKTLVNEYQSAGIHHTVWQGRDEFGRQVASNVYLCRLKNEKNISVIKLLHLR